MKVARKLTRRGFLQRVAGGLAIGAPLLLAGCSRAGAGQVTDQDSGAQSDPPGHGRGQGFTDRDEAPINDPPLRGRGYGSDSDPSDPSLNGRCSDRDAGPNADPQNGSARCRR